MSNDKSRKLECIMSCTAWVTRGTSKSISNQKQVSYLYRATEDVKIALWMKVFSKILTYVFACGVRSLTMQR